MRLINASLPHAQTDASVSTKIFTALWMGLDELFLLKLLCIQTL